MPYCYSKNTFSSFNTTELVNPHWFEIYVLISDALKHTVYLPVIKSALDCCLMPLIAFLPVLFMFMNTPFNLCS